VQVQVHPRAREQVRVQEQLPVRAQLRGRPAARVQAQVRISRHRLQQPFRTTRWTP